MPLYLGRPGFGECPSSEPPHNVNEPARIHTTLPSRRFTAFSFDLELAHELSTLGHVHRPANYKRRVFLTMRLRGPALAPAPPLLSIVLGARRGAKPPFMARKRRQWLA